MTKTYYLTRDNNNQNWRVRLEPGPLTHDKTFSVHAKARAFMKPLNAAIQAERKAAKESKPDGRGRPTLPEHAKAKRVFFTLRPELWKAISPAGDAKELKQFAKVAIEEKLLKK